MMTRLRSTLLAWGGAVLLVLSATGLVAAASLVGDTSQPSGDAAEPLPITTDTTLTWEDLDGDGVDDDCDDAVVADAAAAGAAFLEVDADHDGTISVTESAHSGWIGGKNCNHGGFVSSVARASGEDCDAAETPETPTDEGATGTDGADEGATEAAETDETDEADEAVEADCSESTDASTVETETTPATCEASTEEPAPAPVVDEAPAELTPNAHGKAVRDVAHDKDAVGGKNCSHGGAVSEAAKKDHSADKQHGKDARNAHSNGHGKGHNKP
jgi:hypothetical protein